MLAVMEESRNKKHVEGGDREILYSKAIKAGKRIYYLDVKRNLKDDLFVAVTESKKIQSKDGLRQTFVPVLHFIAEHHGCIPCLRGECRAVV